MIKVVKDETKELHVEFESGDLTIPDLVAAELRDMDSVEFAGVMKDHPEVGKPLLVIRSKKNAKSDMLKAIGNLEDAFGELKSQLAKKKA
jgi:DNA-directed RNA polymerase subunit L